VYELTNQIEELLGQQVRGGSVNASFLCPFHDERTPSFSIHLDSGLWYCFGCGRKGNLEGLYRGLGEELSEEDRNNRLIASVYREPEERKNFASLANGYRREFHTRAGQELWQRFADVRPVTLSAADHFSIGYNAEKSALSFPYWNDDGTVTALKYRHRDGSKSAETGSKRSIYNVTDIVGRPVILLCEGESDTIAAWSRAGKEVSVCGSPGASVSASTWANWSIDFLFARTIYVAFDSDEAGDDGANAAMRVLGDERCVRLRPTRGGDISEHITNGGTLAEIGLVEAGDNV